MIDGRITAKSQTTIPRAVRTALGVGPGDVAIEADYKAYGLPAPSVIRTEKIAVLEECSATRLGSVSDGVLADVQSRVAGYLGIKDAT